MTSTAFTLKEPVVRTTSVIFASPHSGSYYPDEFLARSVLDRHAIRSSEDAFMDDLFEGVTQLGAPLIAAVAPRAYVDLNRAADELDPAVVEGVGRIAHNPRVSSGLGVIPRVVANGRQIYEAKIPLAEARDRVQRYWRPYHAALADLVTANLRQFGEAVLVDCHSMPHEAIENVCAGRHRRTDVVLGDRFGAAAAPEVVDAVEEAFRRAGLVVARNAPFAGAYTTQQYGRPSRGQHAVQIEIDRRLYMDEATIKPHAGYDDFRSLLMGIAEDVVRIGRCEMPLAAE
ncbi:N-formylglutamate amidohydrolase [Roseitranquillus sediminis]|uniref:N-formylglutamate amidohydrolase n=1 Tax=Roseitranquillus sediminis TaxID=2809051 RepID=UPI001D0C49D9|nr:N-formylglutamate amidohydrolase [Roseitranquillus sediminis]MBM9596084.1 N-formylglutamate amidohydrolase [Roseitranquillus sediminis]